MKSFCLEGSTGIFRTQSIQTSLVLFKTVRETARRKNTVKYWQRKLVWKQKRRLENERRIPDRLCVTVNRRFGIIWALTDRHHTHKQCKNRPLAPSTCFAVQSQSVLIWITIHMMHLCNPASSNRVRPFSVVLICLGCVVSVWASVSKRSLYF